MDDGIERSETVGASGKHVESFPRVPSPRSNFDKALLRLLELQARDGHDGLRDGRRSAMLQALERRATWSQIREWRRDRARAPQWALDMLEAKLRERAAGDLEAGALLKSKTAGD
jgi:hypothetical protein